MGQKHHEKFMAAVMSALMLTQITGPVFATNGSNNSSNTNYINRNANPSDKKPKSTAVMSKPKLSEEYKDYLENPEDYQYGYVPFKYELGSTNSLQSGRLRSSGLHALNRASLPSKYDARTDNLVTPVKNQRVLGICWTYSVIADMESDLLKRTGKTYDFNEVHMANNATPHNGIDVGGNGYIASAYLANLTGVVSQEKYKDTTDAVYDPETKTGSIPGLTHLDQYNERNAEMLVRKMELIPFNQIKQSIKDTGAITANLWYGGDARAVDGYYVDDEGKPSNPYESDKFHSPITDKTNHAITLVGWDDDMQIPGAPHKGAFLVKNSHGTEGPVQGSDGKIVTKPLKGNGYFWASYDSFKQDGDYFSFSDVEPIDMSKYNYYRNNKNPAISGMGVKSGNTFDCAVVYTRTESDPEYVQNIGFYPNIPGGGSYKIYAFDASNNSWTSNKNPGELVAEGTVDHVGYYYAKLKSPYKISGNKLGIRVVYTSRVGNGGLGSAANDELSDVGKGIADTYFKATDGTYLLDADKTPMIIDALTSKNPSSETPDADTLEIDNTTTEVKQGESYTFKAKLNGKETTDVLWSVTGAKDPATKMDPSGKLIVGDKETATELTIVCTSKKSSSTKAELKVSVSGKPIESHLTISGSKKEMAPGDTLDLKALVDGKEAEAVKWEVTGAKSKDTKIDTKGYLVIGKDETSESIKVSATLKSDSKATDSVDITIKKPSEEKPKEPETKDLSIKGLESFTKGDLIAMGTGEKAKLSAEVNGKEEKGVTWTVVGATSEKTKVSETGELVIGDDETSKEITLTCSLTEDPTVTKSVTIQIPEGTKEPDPIPEVKITSDKEKVKPGESAQLEATVDGKKAEVKWSITGAEKETTVDENGKLLVAPDETAEFVVVTATLKDRPEISASYKVYIEGNEKPSEEHGIKIIDLPESMKKGESHQLQAKVTGEDDVIIWEVIGSTDSDTKIDQNGKLTIGLNEKAESITIRASLKSDSSILDEAIVFIKGVVSKDDSKEEDPKPEVPKSIDLSDYHFESFIIDQQYRYDDVSGEFVGGDSILPAMRYDSKTGAFVNDDKKEIYGIFNEDHTQILNPETHEVFANYDKDTGRIVSTSGALLGIFNAEEGVLYPPKDEEISGANEKEAALKTKKEEERKQEEKKREEERKQEEGRKQEQKKKEEGSTPEKTSDKPGEKPFKGTDIVKPGADPKDGPKANPKDSPKIVKNSDKMQKANGMVLKETNPKFMAKTGVDDESGEKSMVPLAVAGVLVVAIGAGLILNNRKKRNV